MDYTFFFLLVLSLIAYKLYEISKFLFNKIEEYVIDLAITLRGNL